jgi:hypothetical protein
MVRQISVIVPTRRLYIGWRNRFLGIDSRGSLTFTNSGSEFLLYEDFEGRRREILVFGEVIEIFMTNMVMTTKNLKI